MKREDIVRTARDNIEKGERWHKKVNIREIVFGFNDGSVSTIALLAGVTGGALARGQILVAGFSGVVAGAISMAIGAYISSKSEIEHNDSEIEREKREIEQVPEIEREEVRQLYMRKADFTEDELAAVVNRTVGDKGKWLDFMTREELGFFKERFENPVKVGLIMLLAFFAGGFVPLTPYLIVSVPQSSFLAASVLTYISLFIIGVWKTTFTNKHWLISGGEMVVMGILAAVIPYLIGQLFLPSILSGLIG